MAWRRMLIADRPHAEISDPIVQQNRALTEEFSRREDAHLEGRPLGWDHEHFGFAFENELQAGEGGALLKQNLATGVVSDQAGVGQPFEIEGWPQGER